MRTLAQNSKGCDLDNPQQEKISRRIRAIPKAAGIRFFYADQRDSDAYFYHADKARLDCCPSDYFSERLASEVTVSSQLTLSEFIAALKLNNTTFIERYLDAPFLRKEHFSAHLTDYEREVINAFSDNFAKNSKLSRCLK